MAKREMSSTLKNLKFMQRAAQREEKAKKVDEVVPIGDFSPSGIPRRCVVIVEGDPHPGLSRGRMSFQCFNPAIDKLNEDANSPSQPEASTPQPGHQNGRLCVREDETSQDEFDMGSKSANGDLKRKHPEVTSENLTKNKSKKSFQSAPEAQRARSDFDKKWRAQKLDFSVLRPPKSQKKTE